MNLLDASGDIRQWPILAADFDRALNAMYATGGVDVQASRVVEWYFDDAAWRALWDGLAAAAREAGPLPEGLARDIAVLLDRPFAEVTFRCSKPIGEARKELIIPGFEEGSLFQRVAAALRALRKGNV